MNRSASDIETELERRLKIMGDAWEMRKIADRYPRRLDTNRIDGKVYIVHAQSTKLYKIGITRTHVRYRIVGLKTGCPFPIVLVDCVDTANPEELEKVLHSHLSAHRVNGEWFELSDAILKDAVRLLHEA